jgi:hypothetical protein
MLRRRRSERRNVTKGVMAFSWIALAGVSGLYLFTLFTNPSAFGNQTAGLGSSLGDATSALAGSTGSLSADRISQLLEARDKEFDEVKQQVRDLSQQVADLSARVNAGASPLASNPAPRSPSRRPSLSPRPRRRLSPLITRLPIPARRTSRRQLRSQRRRFRLLMTRLRTAQMCRLPRPQISKGPTRPPRTPHTLIPSRSRLMPMTERPAMASRSAPSPKRMRYVRCGVSS